ncbi:hypothetical protein KJ785_02850 [Patescibacteria group bacterium]|nr:hypothetical protein [Patescibacteria group bacterium]
MLSLFKQNKIKNWQAYLFLSLSLLFYLFTRLWMWFEYGMAGFGYDTGIYRHHILGYFNNLGEIPFGFSAFSNWLMLLGDSVDKIMFNWYLLISVFVLLALYFVAKKYFKSNLVALFSVLLFVSSIVQFEFFWWYYYRQFLALFFILLTFLFIHYRSYLVIFALLAVGIIHPLSLIPLGLSMIIYLFFADKKTKKFLLITGTSSIIFLIILNWRELWVYAQDFFHYKGVAKNFVEAGYQEFTGQFIGWSDWLKYSIFYLPFGLFGLIKYWKKQKLFTIFLLVNILLILLKIVFYHRFFVFVDIALILFASAFLSDVWEKVRGKKYRFLVKIGIILLIVVCGVTTTIHVLEKKPLIYPIELEAIKQVSELTKDSDYILSINSIYSPWLYGYSGKKIIAPGLFEYNKWNREEWNQFWYSPSNEMRLEMLKEYNITPMYIYVGDTNFNLGPNGNFMNNFLLRVDL